MNFGHAALYHGDAKRPDALVETMKRRSFLFLSLVPSLAYAHSYKLGDIAIGHAWGLVSKDGEIQVFVPLLNTGTKSDTLISVTCENTRSAELRLNNDYTLPPETGFTLEPSKPFPMRPSAKHIRLLGLTKPVKMGDRISVILKFENAGETKIEVHIQERPGE